MRGAKDKKKYTLTAGVNARGGIIVVCWSAGIGVGFSILIGPGVLIWHWHWCPHLVLVFGIGILVWHWHLHPLLAIGHVGNSSVVTTLIHPMSSCLQQRCRWCVGSAVVLSRMGPLPPCKQELTVVAWVGMWVLHWCHLVITTKLESTKRKEKISYFKKKH
jgi:hypothetical protein